MRVYLDHAATTSLRPDVLAAYTEALARTGNPSSIHADGQSSRDLVETGRERIASALGADPVEVVLTAGGTEAVNLGIKGLFWARRSEDPVRTAILLPDGEHAATVESVAWLERHEGAEVLRIPLDAVGRIRTEAVADAIQTRPGRIALMTALWASNEVGTIQPVAELAAIPGSAGIPLHVDAIAAFGQVPIDVRATGVAALSIAGHKIGAPVSTGALVVGRRWTVEPVLHGGDQQRGRSGTEDAAGAVALGLAAELAARDAVEAAPRTAALRDRLIAAVADIDGVHLRGDPDAAGRLPGNVHVTVDRADGDGLLYLLDAAGFSVSTGSACRAGVTAPSPVLLAMGLTEDEARGALRMTLGWETTEADVDALAAVLPDVVERTRAALAGHRRIR